MLTRKQLRGLSLFLLLVTCKMTTAAQTNIKATAILFRHGQRTPLRSHPTFNNRLTKELGHGQLTNTGIRQLYNNGALLKEKYKHLFPADGFFKLSNMQIMSSVPERTMMSLQSFMAGFFPPPPRDNSLPVNWQPFFCTVDYEGKMIHFDKDKCPRYAQALFQIMMNPPADLTAWLKDDQAILEELSEHAGRPLKTLLHVGMFADMIKAQIYIDENPPQWAVDAYFSILEKYIDRFFSMFHSTKEMVKIRGGPLLTEIVNNMVAVQGNGPSGKNFLIYSAHDMTVISLAYVLGVESQIPAHPHYSDTFMVDLLDNGEVQVIYMNTEDKNEPTMTVMDLPGCGLSCPLEKFREVYAEMLVDDWNTLCKI